MTMIAIKNRIGSYQYVIPPVVLHSKCLLYAEDIKGWGIHWGVLFQLFQNKPKHHPPDSPPYPMIHGVPVPPPFFPPHQHAWGGVGGIIGKPKRYGTRKCTRVNLNQITTERPQQKALACAPNHLTPTNAGGNMS
jgi:hypothetical protein